MVWYAHPVMLIPLFGAPSLWLLGQITRQLARHQPEAEQQDRDSDDWTHAKTREFMRRQLARNNVAAVILLWLTVLIACTVLGVGSGYVAFYWVSLPSIALALHARLERRVGPNDVRWVVLVMLGFAPALLVSVPVLATFLEFFVPLMGRSGALVPPDLLVAAIAAASAVIVCAPLLSIAPLLSERQWRFTTVGLLLMLLLGGLLPAWSLHPYARLRPERVVMQHVLRERHRAGLGSEAVSDGGVWINALDWQAVSPLRRLSNPLSLPNAPVGSFAAAPAMRCPTDDAVYCNLPYYLPLKDLVRESMWLPTTPPQVPAPALHVVRSAYDGDRDVRRIEVSAHVPSHASLYVRHDPTQPLVRWSFTDVLPQPRGGHWFVFFSSGTELPDDAAISGASTNLWSFWLEQRGRNSTLHVGLATHYHNTTSPALRMCQAVLPEWIAASQWVSALGTWHV